MSKANAQRVVNVINRAIEKNTSDGAKRSYKPAVATTSGSQFISAYIAGETEYASEDIRVPAGAYIGAGDYIIVGFSGEGKSWVNEVLPYSDYSKLVIDPNRAQIKIGDGTTEPDAGADGQIIMSAGSALPAYWSDNFADTVRVAVKNNTGSTLTAGTVVYINGVSGQIPTVTKASASTESASSKTLGVITKNITDTNQGTATTFGVLKNVNTVGYSSGDNLWLSTTAGEWTTTRPSAPNHGVHVGYVITGGSSSAGRIFVYVQNGFELGEIHNVSSYAPANGQALVWDSASSYWKPGTISTALTLDDLTDVAITTPTSGQALKYNGSSWVNGTAAAYLDDLTDVTITSPISGNTLSYNGTAWVNSTPAANTYSGTSLTLVQVGTPTPSGPVISSTSTVTGLFPSSSYVTENWDTDNWHTSSSPYYNRITPTKSGKILVTASVGFAANGSGNRFLQIWVNGTSGTAIAREQVAGTASQQTWVSASGIYDFNGSTEYVEVYVAQNSGGNLEVTGAVVTAQLIGGLKGDTGATGAAGANGTNGTNGAGVVSGGTAGQYLKKNSASDYDTTWYSILGSTAPSTQAIGDAASAGSSAEAAHVDHVHAMPAFGAVTAQTSFGSSSGNGAAATIARSDHTHGTPTNPVTAHEAASDPHAGYLLESVVSGIGTPSLTLSTSNSAGTGTTVIGSGATIAAFDATVPTTIAFGASAAAGSAGYAARRDHTHGAPANPVTAHEAASNPHTGYALLSPSSSQTITSGSASVTALKVSGTSGQSVDIFSVVDSASNKILYVDSSGSLRKYGGALIAGEDRQVDKQPYFSGNTITAQQDYVIPLSIKASPSQVYDLFVIENSAGTDLFTVQADGTGVFTGNLKSNGNLLQLGFPKSPTSSFIVATNMYLPLFYQLTLTGTNRATLSGTATLMLFDDTHSPSRMILSGRG